MGSRAHHRGAVKKRLTLRQLTGLVLWWPFSLSMVTCVTSVVLMGFGVLPDLMRALSSAGIGGAILASNHFRDVRGPKLYGMPPTHHSDTMSTKAMTIGGLAFVVVGLSSMIAVILAR